MQQTIHISGARPAGLTAAIAAVRNGRRVVVYEQRPDVGGRFHGDFQGLESWTTEGDVLEEPTYAISPSRTFYGTCRSCRG